MTSPIRVMRLVGYFVISAACMTMSSTAEAKPSPQTSPEKAAADVRARELFQKGDAAYAEGRYEEALTAFQEAYELSSRPQLLFNISNALERLGRYSEAVDALDKYLASGKARDREVVQKRLANLKKRVEEKKKEEAARLEEEKKKRDGETQAKESDAAKVEATKPPVTTKPVEPSPAPPPSSSGAVLPIALIGVGGAALVTSGIFGALTLSARSDVDAGCKDTPAGRLCEANTQSAIDRDKTFGLVTDITLVAGVILAGVGVYLLATHKSEASSKVKVGGNGLVSGTF